MVCIRNFQIKATITLGFFSIDLLKFSLPNSNEDMKSIEINLANGQRQREETQNKKRYTKQSHTAQFYFVFSLI